MQLPLAIVLTLTFVWLYFNVNFKSDMQFNFPTSSELVFELVRIVVAFCSIRVYGLGDPVAVSLWFLLCSLPVETTDLMHKSCIWNRPLPQPAVLGTP